LVINIYSIHDARSEKHQVIFEIVKIFHPFGYKKKLNLLKCNAVVISKQNSTFRKFTAPSLFKFEQWKNCPFENCAVLGD